MELIASELMYLFPYQFQPRAQSVRPGLDTFPPRFDLAPENDFFA